MKLYHVSYDMVPAFNPRVPANRLPTEDGRTPRICFSTSIEKCINAKPGESRALRKMLGHRIPMMLYVYEIDTELLPPRTVVKPDVVQDIFGVEDAIENDEYWVTTSIDPDESIVEVYDADWSWITHDPHLERVYTSTDISDKCHFFYRELASAAIDENPNGTVTTDMIVNRSLGKFLRGWEERFAAWQYNLLRY